MAKVIAGLFASHPARAQMRPTLRVSMAMPGYVYVARDNPGPEHLVFAPSKRKCIWVSHPEGGNMSMISIPDFYAWLKGS